MTTPKEIAEKNDIATRREQWEAFDDAIDWLSNELRDSPEAQLRLSGLRVAYFCGDKCDDEAVRNMRGKE